MNWIVSSILAAALFSASNAVTKLFQPKLSFGVGMLAFSLGALIVSSLVLLLTKAPVHLPKSAQQFITYAVVAGSLWGVAQVLFLVTLSKNAPLSIAVPFVVASIGVGGVIAGVAFFGEQLTLMRIVGIATVLIGTVLLSR